MAENKKNFEAKFKKQKKGGQITSNTIILFFD